MEDSLRVVLDLSCLFKYLVIPYFKIVFIQSIAMNRVEPMWGCTLDLEDISNVSISWLFHCEPSFILDGPVFVFQ